MVDTDHYRSQLARLVTGRPWIVAKGVLAGATPHVETLESLGAARVLCLATGRGVGPLPEERVPRVLFEPPDLGPGLMAGIRAVLAALGDVPAEVQAAVDAFDPGREARVVGDLWVPGDPIAGRVVLGARDAAWRALEDKTRVEEFWDAAGVPRAPSRVVPVEPGALNAAAHALDRGEGTVWAADDREGFQGGAAGLRWVRDADDAESAYAFLATRADRARVMPFLEGIPCSIHGMVFPDGACIAFRPCEMIVLRDPARRAFHYGRAATFWDPPPADRDAMRAVALKAGRALALHVRYRGLFTIDGVLTADGFRPTELNPRFGAAATLLTQSEPSFPLYLLHLAVASGEPLDYRPAALERLVLALGDGARAGSVGAHVTQTLEPGQRELVLAGDQGWRFAQEGEAAHARAEWGQSPGGSFLRLSLVPAHTPVGPPVGPRAVDLLAALTKLEGLELGTWEAARSVR